MNYSRSKTTMRREWDVVRTHNIIRIVSFFFCEGAKARSVASNPYKNRRFGLPNGVVRRQGAFLLRRKQDIENYILIRASEAARVGRCSHLKYQ